MKSISTTRNQMSENQRTSKHKNDLLKAHCSLYKAYENLAHSGVRVSQQVSTQGISTLEFIGEDYAIKCKLINLLNGVSVHYGSYEGDFSKLKYGFSSPSLHFGLLQSGNYEGVLDCKPFGVRGNEVYLVAPDTHTMGGCAKAHCNCVQIDINIAEAKGDIETFLPTFDIWAFYEFLAQNPLVATACLNMRNLLNGLCEIDNIDLLRLKVLESLLVMWQNAYNLRIKCGACGGNEAKCGTATYSKTSYIAHLADYLETHYNASCEEVSLRALAERFSVCISKLTSDFREVKGISLYQYLKQCKIHNACKLLKDGKTVNQVANEVGYINVSCFCKNFREIVGVSPNKFAKNAS